MRGEVEVRITGTMTAHPRRGVKGRGLGRAVLGVAVLVAAAALSLSCPPTAAPTTTSGSTVGEPAPVPTLRALAEPSSGSCPDLRRGGVVDVQSAGLPRSVTLLLPPGAPPRMPVLFVWHGLGATPASMIPRLGLRALADRGVAVVVPAAWPEADIGWGFTKDREDLVLFDDLRTCLARTLDVDLGRVVTAGFSAGGLWSTFLLMERADALAGAIPMSGGLLPPILSWREPAWRLPVLLFDGGARDVYRKGPVTVRFEETTARLAERLRAAGHRAVRCPSPSGHKVPVGSADLVHRYALAARYGEEAPTVTLPADCSADDAPRR